MKAEDVKKIAVIGAGDMGHGITAAFLMGGFAVAMRDIEQEYVDRGVAGIKRSFDRFKSRGKLSEEAYCQSRLKMAANSNENCRLKNAACLR